MAVAAAATPHDWRRSYAIRLAVSDFVALVWVIFGVQIAYLGIDAGTLKIQEKSFDLALNYVSISLGLIGGWMMVLQIFGTRTYRVVGLGSEEYKLVANASFALFGTAAIAAYLLSAELARGYVLLAFPLGTLLLLLTRWMWRQWLGAKRRTGGYSSRVVLVGTPESVQRISLDLARQTAAGYHVVGACVPGGRAGSNVGASTIPVLGSLSEVPSALEAAGADTVVVTSSDEFTSRGMRELSWSLEPGRFHLVVVPRLIDVGGPRIHTRPVAGLPLIHVETPRYDGSTLFVKRVFDILGASVLLALLSPLLLAVVAGVRLSTPGPAFFSQPRVGIDGDTFRMFKFRSMIVDAEQRLATLVPLAAEQRSAGNSMMFKMQDDPRITPLGRLLRRYSIDELPQLVNVLNGSMSLVGPRPPLATEVETYEDHVHRRFLVKPGVTGLWQISGRSNLTWEETVRLDLYYVENWSLMSDIIILFRTAKAVVSRDGAF